MKAITHSDLTHEFYTIAKPAKYAYTAKAGIWERFIAFADRQQDKRLLWAAISILGHGTIFTIGTIATVILLGNVLPLLAIACFTMTMVVVVNLAALPTKYIIPIFFLSLLIDLGVIITAILLH
jgi:hypothetical protein